MTGDKRGSIAFFTTYRPPVALDIFSVSYPPTCIKGDERRMTDGVSYNHHGYSIPSPALKTILKRPKLSAENITDLDVDCGRVSGMIFVSERDRLETLQIALLFNYVRKPKVFSFEEVYDLAYGPRLEDSACIARNYLIYVSTKQPASHRRQPWTAVYRTDLCTGETTRLTPPCVADLNPSVSPSGKKIAVASFENRGGWTGEIQDLQLSIFVMNVEEPYDRKLVVKSGGWPTWGSEDILFFHKKVGDIWGVFRADISKGDTSDEAITRITPETCNAMTPVAINNTTVAVAMIRDLADFGIDRDAQHYRHVLVFDISKSNFQHCPQEITQITRSKADHFDPFVIRDDSGNVKRIGYHRVYTEIIEEGQLIEKQFHKIESPYPDVGLFRLSGAFPTFSNDGTKVAFVDNEFKAVWVADKEGLRMVYEIKAEDNLKGESLFSPVWNQNTDKDILYVCRGPAFSANKTLDICAIPNVSKDGNHDCKTLTNGGYNNAFPFTNPAGTKIVFRSTRDYHGNDNGYKNLYIMDAESGDSEIIRLTTGEWVDTHCQWSPNGKWIVFSSSRDKPKDIKTKDNGLDEGYFAVFLVNPECPDVVVRVLGSGEDLAGHVNHPVFSPDGKSVIVVADLAGVSVDPISLPLVEHSVRPYGDIFCVDIDEHDIHKNKNVKNFKRITHTRYENSTASWTMFSTEDPNAAWNLQFYGDYQPSCPYAPPGAESWHMTGHLCIPKRSC